MTSRRVVPWCLAELSHGVLQGHPITSHRDVSQGCPMVMILGDVPCVSQVDWDWKHFVQNVVRCSEGRGRVTATLLPEGLAREGGFTKYGTVTTTRIVDWGGHMLPFFFFYHYCLTSCVWQSSDSVWNPAVIRLRLDLRGLVHLNWHFVVVPFIVDGLWRRVCTVRRKGMQFSLTLFLPCINIPFFILFLFLFFNLLWVWV